MKKFLSLLCICCLSVSIITACGKKEEVQEQKVITALDSTTAESKEEGTVEEADGTTGATELTNEADEVTNESVDESTNENTVVLDTEALIGTWVDDKGNSFEISKSSDGLEAIIFKAETSEEIRGTAETDGSEYLKIVYLDYSGLTQQKLENGSVVTEGEPEKKRIEYSIESVTKEKELTLKDNSTGVVYELKYYVDPTNTGKYKTEKPDVTYEEEEITDEEFYEQYGDLFSDQTLANEVDEMPEEPVENTESQE